jgi:predicted metal-dependent peptidase
MFAMPETDQVFTDEQIEKIEQKVSKARFILRKRSTFFGALVSHMPMVRKDKVRTCAVNKKGEFLYNPAFIEMLDMETLIFAIAHEVMHLALDVFGRVGTRDHSMFNKAHDYVINLMLNDEGFKVWEHALMDDRFYEDFHTKTIMTAENVYDILAAEKQDGTEDDPGEDGGSIGDDGDPSDSNDESDSNDDDESDGGSGDGEEEDDSKDGDGDGDGSSKDDSNDGDSKGGKGKGKPKTGLAEGGGCCYHDDDDGEKTSPREVEKQRQRWQRRLIQACTIGNAPGAMKDYIEDLLHPTLPWRELLKAAFTNAVLATDYTFSRPNRRNDNPDLILSSLTKDKAIPTLACDLSGSMEDRFIHQAVSEMVSVLNEFNLPVRVIGVDTIIQDDVEADDADAISKALCARGGGTNFDALFKRLESEEVSTLVMFTDLYVNLPSTPMPYPVIWICPPQHGDAPWGEVIEIDPDKVEKANKR